MKIKKQIPNFITLMNLLFGILALIELTEGNFITSAVFTGIAGILDFMDGMAARLLKAYSETGKQLDSLADMVSFGVVPGLFLFLIMNEMPATNNLLDFLKYSPVLIPLFSALRLARFNLDTQQQYAFKGLPVPASALFFITLGLVVHPDIQLSNPSALFINKLNISLPILIGLTIVFALLMILPLKLFSLKYHGGRLKNYSAQLFFLILSGILILLFSFAAGPAIITLYVVMSVIKYYI
jgi:CDP-diacylglycerol--serine O-phosphatidyltransferase